MTSKHHINIQNEKGVSLTNGFITMSNEKRIITLTDDTNKINLKESQSLKQIIFGIWLAFKQEDTANYEDIEELIIKYNYIIYRRCIEFILASGNIETIFSPNPDEGVFLMILFFKTSQCYFEVKLLPNEEEKIFINPALNSTNNYNFNLRKSLEKYSNNWLINIEDIYINDNDVNGSSCTNEINYVAKSGKVFNLVEFLTDPCLGRSVKVQSGGIGDEDSKNKNYLEDDMLRTYQNQLRQSDKKVDTKTREDLSNSLVENNENNNRKDYDINYEDKSHKLFDPLTDIFEPNEANMIDNNINNIDINKIGGNNFSIGMNFIKNTVSLYQSQRNYTSTSKIPKDFHDKNNDQTTSKNSVTNKNNNNLQPKPSTETETNNNDNKKQIKNILIYDDDLNEEPSFLRQDNLAFLNVVNTGLNKSKNDSGKNSNNKFSQSHSNCKSQCSLYTLGRSNHIEIHDVVSNQNRNEMKLESLLTCKTIENEQLNKPKISKENLQTFSNSYHINMYQPTITLRRQNSSQNLNLKSNLKITKTYAEKEVQTENRDNVNYNINFVNQIQNMNLIIDEQNNNLNFLQKKAEKLEELLNKIVNLVETKVLLKTNKESSKKYEGNVNENQINEVI